MLIYQTLKLELMPILYNVSQKIEEVEIFHSLFYMVSCIDIKSEKHDTQKEKAGQ